MKLKHLVLCIVLCASPIVNTKHNTSLATIDTAIRKRCEEAHQRGAFDLLDYVKSCPQVVLEVALSSQSHMPQKEAFNLLKRAVKEFDTLLFFSCKSFLEMIDMHYDLQRYEQELQQLLGCSSLEAYKHTTKIMHSVVKEKAEQFWFIGPLITLFNDNPQDSIYHINKEYSEVLDVIEEEIREMNTKKSPTIQLTLCLITYRYALLLDEIKNQVFSDIS